ncbi:hypothetical protein PR048_033697 [Dryococelus australis]|uniref:Uncharacterized protein n=1 Tax=Dryococelus australis TaxID=614101 RepID=A0ABQ9G497_9NEOP|nr:hypothetical protein PR048_033697 [Dryococelus australis]
MGVSDKTEIQLKTVDVKVVTLRGRHKSTIAEDKFEVSCLYSTLQQYHFDLALYFHLPLSYWSWLHRTRLLNSAMFIIGRPSTNEVTPMKETQLYFFIGKFHYRRAHSFLLSSAAHCLSLYAMFKVTNTMAAIRLSLHLPRPMRAIEVRMERRRNEGAGESGDPRENPLTNGIVRHKDFGTSCVPKHLFSTALELLNCSRDTRISQKDFTTSFTQQALAYFATLRHAHATDRQNPEDASSYRVPGRLCLDTIRGVSARNEVVFVQMRTRPRKFLVRISGKILGDIQEPQKQTTEGRICLKASCRTTRRRIEITAGRTTESQIEPRPTSPRAAELSGSERQHGRHLQGHGAPAYLESDCGRKDKIDVKHVYIEVDFAIRSQFIRHALDDSEPIADLQGNKYLAYKSLNSRIFAIPNNKLISFIDVRLSMTSILQIHTKTNKLKEQHLPCTTLYTNNITLTPSQHKHKHQTHDGNLTKRQLSAPLPPERMVGEASSGLQLGTGAILICSVLTRAPSATSLLRAQGAQLTQRGVLGVLPESTYGICSCHTITFSVSNLHQGPVQVPVIVLHVSDLEAQLREEAVSMIEDMLHVRDIYGRHCTRHGTSGWVFQRLLVNGDINEHAAGFLEDLPFPPPLHSGAAPYSPRFTLIVSQDLAVKICPNLPIHFTAAGKCNSPGITVLFCVLAACLCEKVLPYSTGQSELDNYNTALLPFACRHLRRARNKETIHQKCASEAVSELRLTGIDTTLYRTSGPIKICPCFLCYWQQWFTRLRNKFSTANYVLETQGTSLIGRYVLLCTVHTIYCTGHCDKCPVAPSWFETRSEIGSKIDTENCCTIRVQSLTGDRDQVHFEPTKLAVRNLDARSAVIVDKLNHDARNCDKLLQQPPGEAACNNPLPSASQRWGTWTPKRRTDIDHCKAGFPHPTSSRGRSRHGYVRPPSTYQLDIASGVKNKDKANSLRYNKSTAIILIISVTPLASSCVNMTRADSKSGATTYWLTFACRMFYVSLVLTIYVKTFKHPACCSLHAKKLFANVYINVSRMAKFSPNIHSGIPTFVKKTAKHIIKFLIIATLNIRIFAA